MKLLFYLQFVSETTNTLKAIHETPSKHYKDDLTFTFSDAGMNCKTEVLYNVYFYILPLACVSDAGMNCKTEVLWDVLIL